MHTWLCVPQRGRWGRMEEVRAAAKEGYHDGKSCQFLHREGTAPRVSSPYPVSGLGPSHPALLGGTAHPLFHSLKAGSTQNIKQNRSQHKGVPSVRLRNPIWEALQSALRGDKETAEKYSTNYTWTHQVFFKALDKGEWTHTPFHSSALKW